MLKAMLVLLVLSVVACADGKLPGPGADPGEKEELIFPALIGGDVADPKEWPNSHFGTSGNSGCSGTSVGERAYLSAAHCMRDGGTVKFSVGPNQYTSKCTHHQDYRQADWELLESFARAGITRAEVIARRLVTEETIRNATADWAMCFTDRVVVGGPFEVMNTDPSLVKKGDYIVLSGYGCRKWGGPIDGKFRIGRSPVIRLPSGTNHDIVTSGKAALCSGDSGGAAYSDTGATRVVVGCNSRSNTTTDSYMPSVAQPTAQAFFKSWATKVGALICGVHPAAKNCRGLTPPPGPTEFTVEAKVAKVTAKLNPGFEQYFVKLKEEIERVLASFAN